MTRVFGLLNSGIADGASGLSTVEVGGGGEVLAELALDDIEATVDDVADRVALVALDVVPLDRGDADVCDEVTTEELGEVLSCVDNELVVAPLLV